MKAGQKFTQKHPVLTGVLLLVFGFIVGTLIAVLVVESSTPSKAGNDGWLGFLGGVFGSMISGMVSFYILYLDRQKSEEIQENNRKETMAIQEKQRKQFEYQIRKRFTDSIAESVARYITDICGYFYSQYFSKDDKRQYLENPNKKPWSRGGKENRRKAVEEYYVLTMKLHEIPAAKVLLDVLKNIHNAYCFLDIAENVIYQKERFEDNIDMLRNATTEFIRKYLEEYSD